MADIIKENNKRTINFVLENAEKVRGQMSDKYAYLYGWSYIGPNSSGLEFVHGEQQFPDPHKWCMLKLRDAKKLITQELEQYGSKHLNTKNYEKIMNNLSKVKALSLEEVAKREEVPASELQRVMEEGAVTGIYLYNFRDGKAEPHLPEDELYKIIQNLAKKAKA